MSGEGGDDQAEEREGGAVKWGLLQAARLPEKVAAPKNAVRFLDVADTRVNADFADFLRYESCRRLLTAVAAGGVRAAEGRVEGRAGGQIKRTLLSPEFS
jgi:hypothetical protein